MAVYKIIEKDDKLLREHAKPVPKITSNVIKLINNMLETMYKSDGVGLAAPQVGVLKRVIVIDVGEGPVKLINPEIIASSCSHTVSEGCLSCPGLIGDVKRAKRVTVKGLLPDGTETIIEAEDLFARALQHEIDHLDGVLFIDKAKRLKRLE